MRNCVVLFCGSSLHSPLLVVAVLLWFFCHWASIVNSLNWPPPLPFPSLIPLPLCDRGACENAPAYHSHCLLFVFPYYMSLSLSFSLHFSLSSRFSDYLFEFRQVCFQLVDVFICLALTLFSFGQLIALVLLLSFILCFYFPLLFSLLFRYMSLLQVCLGYQFYLRCKFVP